MSEQSQTTTNTATEPVLCKKGCGFFGDSTFGGCCSKCWREEQKKKGADISSPRREVKAALVDAAVSDVRPVVVEEKIAEEAKPEAPKQTEEAPKKKKGKKKLSYKNMMAGMMNNASSRDVANEKEALRKVTGGGAFSKVEKI